jgi:preprotein translocase subunit SecD
MRNSIGLKTLLAITLITFAGFACSRLRPHEALTWHIVVEVDPRTPSIERAVADTVAIIERRLDIIGIRDFKVGVLGEASKGRIQVNLPHVTDQERMKKFITAGGHLEIVHVISPPNPAPVLTYDSIQAAEATVGKQGQTLRVLPFVSTVDELAGGQKKWAVVETPAIVEGRDLRNASAVPSSARANDYQISFTLRTEGANKLATWTGANINQYIGVVLNDEIKSIAFIKSQISDSGEISGRFTKQSAEDLAQILNSGPLPAPVRIIEERNN